MVAPTLATVVRLKYNGQCLNHFHGTAPMKYLPALAAVCLLIVPSVASAQQLPGDPNPHGTTVTVTDYNHNLDLKTVFQQRHDPDQFGCPLGKHGRL